MGTTDTSFTVATAVSASIGDLVQIDQEVMVVQRTVTSGTTVSVTRASHGTSAGAHAVRTGVYILAEKIFILPFAQDFFGSPASGSYAFPITIPDVRIAAADLFMTNSRGNSSVAAESFTSTTDFGLRSLLGGQLTIQVEGLSRFKPTQRLRFWWRLRAPCAMFMQWCRMPLPERPVVMQVTQNGVVYCELTIATGATVSNDVDGFALGPLQAQAIIGLNITSVVETAEHGTG